MCLNCSEDHSEVQTISEKEGRKRVRECRKVHRKWQVFQLFFAAVADSAAEPPNTWLAPLQLMCALYPEVKDRKRALKLMMRKRREEERCFVIGFLSLAGTFLVRR